MPIVMINIVFKRDFKLYECDDCSECPLKHQCIKYKLQIKTKPSTVKKLMWSLFLDLLRPFWISLECPFEE